MRFIQITRFPSSVDKGTRGVMCLDNQPFLVTLELPWCMNVPFKSCIPVGLYYCERYTSDRYKETFIILKVHDRTKVLFHIGNFLKDTDGCVCTGLSFGIPGEDALIRDSRIAFFRFMETLENEDRFLLQIRNAF